MIKFAQYVLAILGYVKIPKEVVLLSMEQERFIKGMVDFSSDVTEKLIFEKFLYGQCMLTKFLRSGKLLYK